MEDYRIRQIEQEGARNGVEDAAEAPIPIDRESQLFVDDHLISDSRSLMRRLNRPRKEAEPFLSPKYPWEGQSLLYGSIVKDDSAYRLYYKARNWSGEEGSSFRNREGFGKVTICIARSDDALSFSRRPVEGAVHQNTNIVIDDEVDCFGVLKDHRDDDPEEAYKLIACLGNDWMKGLTTATSADGIEWNWGKRNGIAHFGDRLAYWFHPQRQTHMVWSRHWPLLPWRMIVEKETEDFGDWADPPHSPRIAIQPDRFDHPETQFYGAYPFWYKSLFLAYIEMFYVHHQRLDTQLAASRDGINWTRLCNRDIFLPNGEHGEHDAYWVVPTFNPPILQDGRLLIHYNGRAVPHTIPGFRHVSPGMTGTFALSTLREDGFVSLDSTGNPGVLTTRLLRAGGERRQFEVNACPFIRRPAVEPMHLELRILSQENQMLGAWEIRSSWNDERVWHRIALPKPLPELFRVEFKMTNTRLYSFRLN